MRLRVRAEDGAAHPTQGCISSSKLEDASRHRWIGELPARRQPSLRGRTLLAELDLLPNLTDWQSWTYTQPTLLAELDDYISDPVPKPAPPPAPPPPSAPDVATDAAVSRATAGVGAMAVGAPSEDEPPPPSFEEAEVMSALD